MNSIQLIKPPSPVHDMLNEVIPLIDVVVVSGRPAVFILGPGLLFVLVLVGPLLLLVTLASIAFLAVLLAAMMAEILAMPYLLVRRLRRRRATCIASPLLVGRVRAAKP